MPQRRIDLNELAKRVRRRGLLRALAERPQRPPPLAPAEPIAPPPAPLAPKQDSQDTDEFEAISVVGGRLARCRLSAAAVITGLADLPAIGVGGQVIDVALLRMRVRRPEGDFECCVRQHVPREIRAVMAPGAGVMVLAHENDRAVAVVDWTATGEWIGAKLTFPMAEQQYDWPPREEWPEAGEIEVYDIDGHHEELDERRVTWGLASADLVSLTPLRSRVDQRDEWQIALRFNDGGTVSVRDRVPLLALARLRMGNESRVGAPIDVLVSRDGEVAVDWEATLNQPALRDSG